VAWLPGKKQVAHWSHVAGKAMDISHTELEIEPKVESFFDRASNTISYVV
jgi:hypothetical protein